MGAYVWRLRRNLSPFLDEAALAAHPDYGRRPVRSRRAAPLSELALFLALSLSLHILAAAAALGFGYLAGVGEGAPGAGDGAGAPVFMVSLADSQSADSLGDGAGGGEAVTEEAVTDETITEEPATEEVITEEPVAEEVVPEEPTAETVYLPVPEKPKAVKPASKPLADKPKTAENKPRESRAQVAAGPGDGAGSAGSAGPKGGGGGGGGGGDAAGYLKGNFEYIKRRIRQYLVYSPQAKRMGIQGTVTVSFIIEKDGRARNAAVVGSSGHEGLDESALKAVRNASPFPPPPDTARIVVPISFSLK